MSYPFYTGTRKQIDAEIELPRHEFVRDQGAKYIPAEELVKVVNVALLLGQPLLITGDPGAGKTQLAYSLGWELNLKVHHFETKSVSNAKDLFYTYDTLGRFHDAHLKRERSATDYISYNAFGCAILQSNRYEKVKQWLPSDYEVWNKPARSIVLIDEIDKAPRDFPNDLLNEIEKLFFRIPELGSGMEEIKADDKLSPIIIITSNSEKFLPEAFLRRCVYYNLKFPQGTLKEIINAHIPSTLNDTSFLSSIVDFFRGIQEIENGLEKPLSISEFINWLSYLNGRGFMSMDSLINHPDEAKVSLCALVKTKHDQETVTPHLLQWLNNN